MNVEQKKENLKWIILNSKHNYDLLIYRLLNKQCLDEIIDCIDDIPVTSNVDPKEIITANEQFIILLNRFILCYKRTFYMQNLDEFIIEYIIESNIEQMKIYLLSKYYQGDNNYISFFNDNIYRIMVHNFIENANHISIIQDILKKTHIPIKKISNYNLEEIYKIKNILSDLVFCCTDKLPAAYLFKLLDLEYSKCEKKYLQGKKNNETEWKNFKIHKKNIFNQFQIQYKIIFEEYKKRKKYLSHFK